MQEFNDAGPKRSMIDGHNLVIKDAREEEAGNEVQSWLKTIGMLK